MCNYHRRPSIDVSYQVFFIWPSGFSQEDFLEINQPETKMAAMLANGLGRKEESL